MVESVHACRFDYWVYHGLPHDLGKPKLHPAVAPGLLARDLPHFSDGWGSSSGVVLAKLEMPSEKPWVFQVFFVIKGMFFVETTHQSPGFVPEVEFSPIPVVSCGSTCGSFGTAACLLATPSLSEDSHIPCCIV